MSYWIYIIAGVNDKFVKQIVNQYKKTTPNVDPDIVKLYLQRWDQYKQKLKPINDYKTFQQLEEAVKDLRTTKERELELKTIDTSKTTTVYKDGVWTAVSTADPVTLSKLAQGSAWCVRNARTAEDYLNKNGAFTIVQKNGYPFAAIAGKNGGVWYKTDSDFESNASYGIKEINIFEDDYKKLQEIMKELGRPLEPKEDKIKTHSAEDGKAYVEQLIKDYSKISSLNNRIQTMLAVSGLRDEMGRIPQIEESIAKDYGYLATQEWMAYSEIIVHKAMPRATELAIASPYSETSIEYLKLYNIKPNKEQKEKIKKDALADMLDDQMPINSIIKALSYYEIDLSNEDLKQTVKSALSGPDWVLISHLKDNFKIEITDEILNAINYEGILKSRNVSGILGIVSIANIIKDTNFMLDIEDAKSFARLIISLIDYPDKKVAEAAKIILNHVDKNKYKEELLLHIYYSRGFYEETIKMLETLDIDAEESLVLDVVDKLLLEEGSLSTILALRNYYGTKLKITENLSVAIKYNLSNGNFNVASSLIKAFGVKDMSMLDLEKSDVNSAVLSRLSRGFSKADLDYIIKFFDVNFDDKEVEDALYRLLIAEEFNYAKNLIKTFNIPESKLLKIQDGFLRDKDKFSIGTQMFYKFILVPEKEDVESVVRSWVDKGEIGIALTICERFRLKPEDYIPKRKPTEPQEPKNEAQKEHSEKPKEKPQESQEPVNPVKQQDKAESNKEKLFSSWINLK